MTITEAIRYLDWYFHDDDGMADKNAAESWETLKSEIERSVIFDGDQTEH